MTDKIKIGDLEISRVSKEAIVLNDDNFALIAAINKLTDSINKLVSISA